MTSNRGATIPDVGEGKRGEGGLLGYLLRQASAAVRSAIDHALADLNVTNPQFLVMTMIDAYPGSSSADLARLTMLTPQTICVIVANLEKGGRVTRESSPSHGRIQTTSLTEAGVMLLKECKRRVRQVEVRVEATLDPAFEPELRRWLVSLAAADLSTATR